MVDPTEAAGLVVRTVRTGERDGQATRIVVAARTYDTGPADLWDAITNPERLPRWFLPLHGDLRVGGRYQLDGNAGGLIEVCEQPERLAVTWEYGDTVSWLTVTLAAEGAVTRLRLEHESPVDPKMWGEYGPGALGVGWDLALLGLGMHVDTGEPVDPAFAATFTFSDDGVSFVRSVATAWAAAAAADGDDAGAAREAGVRTLAFYTTMPEPSPEG